MRLRPTVKLYLQNTKTDTPNTRLFCPHYFTGFSGSKKICLRYFKIGQTYFEICALYFFFSPMWGKQTENQFSSFRALNRPFRSQSFLLFYTLQNNAQPWIVRAGLIINLIMRKQLLKSPPIILRSKKRFSCT